MKNRPVYLDNNATTPLDPHVLEAMLPYLRESFGNPSSQHAYGYEALKAVNRAREQVATLIGCDPTEIFWTSGATESNNLSLFGVARRWQPQECHIVTSQVEHKCVLSVAAKLAREGYTVSFLQPDSHGQVEANVLARALTPKTRLVSVMAANNEVGTLNPIAQLTEVTRGRDIVFHCDAAQALGKIPFDVRRLGIDLASFSGHKIYGPKGVGALYVRKGVQLNPLWEGGGQEGGIRPGTLNVPAIVGFGLACEIAGASLQKEEQRLRALQNSVFKRLKEITPQLVLNGHPNERLPGNLNLSLPGVDPSELTLNLSRFAFSRGSACNQGEVSYVLTNLGVSPDLAQRSLRLGFGRFNTLEDADQLVAQWRAFRS